MKVTLCDKCGKQFKPFDSSGVIKESSSSATRYVVRNSKMNITYDRIETNVASATHTTQVDKNYDLCPSCAVMFLKWIGDIEDNDNDK